MTSDQWEDQSGNRIKIGAMGLALGLANSVSDAVPKDTPAPRSMLTEKQKAERTRKRKQRRKAQRRNRK